MCIRDSCTAFPQRLGANFDVAVPTVLRVVENQPFGQHLWREAIPKGETLRYRTRWETALLEVTKEKLSVQP